MGMLRCLYVVKTSEIMVDIVRALTEEQLKVDDNEILNLNIVVHGVFNYSSGNVAYTAPFNNNPGNF